MSLNSESDSHASNGSTYAMIDKTMLALLNDIASKSFDLVQGRDWEEYAVACGGLAKLEADHAAAVRRWRAWSDDG